MGILLRNWHLKLSAVLLATVLYTGLVFSGQFSDAEVQLTIGITGQPPNSAVLSGTPGSVDVTYRARNDLTGTLSADSFRATVDLSAYDMERAPEPQVLPVDVVSLVEGVEIIRRDPVQVTVEIDRLIAAVVPVDVDYGEVPDTVEVDEPVTSVDEVEVRGAASLVQQVDRVVARVLIDESGIRVERTVPVEPVDLSGQPVENVSVEPREVTVEIDVNPVETNRTVSVRPQLTGVPAAGFALSSIGVDPTAVTIRGLPDVLTATDELLTEPIDLADLSEDQELEVELILPDDVRLLEPADGVVTVTLTFEPSVSGRTFVVGVICQGGGDNACVPGLEQVAVTLSGPAAAFAGLTAADITPVVDISGLDPGSYSLSPTISGLPDGVSLDGVSPASIPVTVVAPTTPEPTPSPEP